MNFDNYYTVFELMDEYDGVVESDVIVRSSDPDDYEYCLSELRSLYEWYVDGNHGYSYKEVEHYG